MTNEHLEPAVGHRRISAGLLAIAVTAGITFVASSQPAAADPDSASNSGTEQSLQAPSVRSAHDLTAPTVRSARSAGSDGAGSGSADADNQKSEGQEKAQAAKPSDTHAALPGVGPKNMAKLPGATRQVIVASSPKQSGSRNTVTFYERSGDTWKALKSFHGHNGSKGWTTKHKEGDLRTPSGVYGLTDAGGHDKNPGTKLPYKRDTSMNTAAATAYGRGYENVFDYVVAINYNRKSGKPPQDSTRPDGWDKGGGIWLHLDHDTGTHGCVTLDRKDLKWIMRQLDPAAKPQIVMGSAADVAK